MLFLSTEQLDASIFCTVGFQPFKGLLLSLIHICHWALMTASVESDWTCWKSKLVFTSLFLSMVFLSTLLTWYWLVCQTIIMFRIGALKIKRSERIIKSVATMLIRVLRKLFFFFLLRDMLSPYLFVFFHYFFIFFFGLDCCKGHNFRILIQSCLLYTSSALTRLWSAIWVVLPQVYVV